MQNLKAGHAGTASSGLNHIGLSQRGEISASRAEKVRAARRLVPMHLIGA